MLIDMGDGTIYDTDLQLTWLKDAQIGGEKSWREALIWAANLVFAGLDNWRLPSAEQPVVDSPLAGEMAHLFVVDLGNIWGHPLTNSGPFTNLQPYAYWTGTTFDPAAYWYEDPLNPDPCLYAYYFDFSGGGGTYPKARTLYAWAVRPGKRSISWRYCRAWFRKKRGKNHELSSSRTNTLLSTYPMSQYELRRIY